MFMFSFPRNDISELSESDGRFHFVCVLMYCMYYSHLAVLAFIVIN